MPEPTLAATQPTTLEWLDAQGHGVRVAFQKNGDRFRHTIFAVRDGELTPLLTSVEGTPEEIALPSPSFAELHQQGETVFLSGATTQGHWSMSVEVAEGQLLFDVACRLKRQTEWLGSTYQIGESDYCLQCQDDTSSERESDLLTLFPKVREAKNYPATMQWRYTIATST